MRSKNIFLLGLIVLLFLSVPLTIFVLQRNQENRSSAAKSTTLYFDTTTPGATKVVKPGEEFVLDLYVNPGNNLVSTVRYAFAFDPAVFTPVPEKFNPNLDVFRQVVEGPIYSTGQAIGVVTIGNNPTGAVSQPTRVASFSFKTSSNTSLLTGTKQIELLTGSDQTQVFSISSNDSASENVLESAVPATISFDIPPTPTIVIPPTATPTPSPTGQITSTSIGNCPAFPSCNVNVVWQTQSAPNVSLQFGETGTKIPVNASGSYNNVISIPTSIPVILYSGSMELDRKIVTNDLTPTATPTPTTVITPIPDLTLSLDSVIPKANNRRDVNLSWNNVGDATYSVYMKTGTGTYATSPVAVGGLSATVDVANNTAYTFKVTACTTTVLCKTSNEVSVPATTSVFDVTINLAVFLHGIGNSGDNKNADSSLSNKNPLTVTKEVTVGLYSKLNSNQLIKEAKGMLSYVPVPPPGDIQLAVLSGYYDGAVTIPSVPEGEYTFKVKTDKYLQKVYPGIVSVDSSIVLDSIHLVSGDVNNDNKLDILDYNEIMDCYSDALPARACSDPTKKAMTDLTDDGKNNHFDYNLFIRELSVQFGQ